MKKVLKRLYFNYFKELLVHFNGTVVILNTSIQLRNGNASGSKLVGFQKGSGYDSYQKEQGLNAPISVQANDKYTAALNSLIAPKSRNKFFFNKDTLVFWADKDNVFEDLFSAFFTSPPKDDPDSNVEKISALMKAPLTGSLIDDDDTRFFLLLLSPNNKRIAVKLWEEATVRDFAKNIRQYFNDLEIVCGQLDKKYMPLNNLLRSISILGKEENLPPQLFLSMVRAIMEGLPFPELLQTQVIGRIRADRIINRNRAALLKAYLNRKRNNNEKQITMALDLNNTNQAYLCGRLFAIFEKIQQEANGELNASIRDRYYDSFSCTPNVVFARLSALSNHHLQKLTSKGRQVYFEKLKGDVMDNISSVGLPAHFSLDDQSRFVIGYYQQWQDFFKKKEKIINTPTENL